MHDIVQATGMFGWAPTGSQAFVWLLFSLGDFLWLLIYGKYGLPCGQHHSGLCIAHHRLFCHKEEIPWILQNFRKTSLYWVWPVCKGLPWRCPFIGTGGKPQIKDFSEFGWNDCWQRDHCLAVYQGAIEIGGYSSDDNLTLLLVKLTSGTLDTLITHALLT